MHHTRPAQCPPTLAGCGQVQDNIFEQSEPILQKISATHATANRLVKTPVRVKA
jgi:hypothetical protein